MTGYLLERRSPGLEWIRLNDSLITGLKRTVHNLDPLTKYQFRVAALNQFGTGSFSETSELITTKAPSIPDQPGRPVIVKVVGTSVTMEWTVPEDNGEKITSYIIRYGVPGADTTTYSEARFDGKVPTCTVTKLKPKTKFHFAVSAENKLGCGAVSEFSDFIFTYKHSG